MKVIKDETKQFIADNSANHTIPDLMAMLGLKKSTLYSHLTANNLPYKQHPGCRYKDVVKDTTIDFDCCPITGLRGWN